MKKPSHGRVEVIYLVSVLAAAAAAVAAADGHRGMLQDDHFEYKSRDCRAHYASLTDFGGVGDGKTSNTKAFRDAIKFLSQYEKDGGSMLFVPAGKWLTGNFNITTSHFTLFLHKDAVLLASQVESEWALIDPLPSYGRGRDALGERYISFIFGTNLTDVVITGNNGTIDGQGKTWYAKFLQGQLRYTRPYLIEIMHSHKVEISNVTLVNSPSWNVHPVYSSNVVVRGITILSPEISPNTDGINPDSCTNVLIEDCYIVSGDDCIAVKSGWDQYGIAFGMPTLNVYIRRVTCISPTSATIALGSEMSGGIQHVRAEDIVAINTEAAVSIKTAVGRGAYVKDVYVKGVTMNTMRYVFRIRGTYGSHADQKFDPKAVPVIDNINYRDMVAQNVTQAAKLEGVPGFKSTGICISNVTINLAAKPKKLLWNCSSIEGVSTGVTPTPCDLLPAKGQPSGCNFPTEPLPVKEVEVQTCSSKKEAPPKK